MSGPEIRSRASQEFDKRRDVLLYRLGRDPYRGGFEGSNERGRFFCDAGDVPGILEILRRRLPDQAESILARAERILAGRFDLLGYRDLDFGREIDWNLDPVHGKRAPSVPWPSVPFLDFDAVGDHKVIWELSRLQFLLTLGKAWRLSGDRRFADRLKQLCDDWRRKNPYPLGINWASTLEVAFRSLSLMWSAFLLEGTEADSPEFQRGIAREIARGAWYIDRFLSTYFSPNTHLLGEGAALFLIALRYPGLPRAAQWRETGWRIVLEEAHRQVRADGLHFEQSIYYHVYALDFFLHARLLAARNEVVIPKDLDDTIRAMASALVQLSQAGALPRFGDDDGGRLFDGSRNQAGQMLDPLSTAAVLYKDSNFKTAATFCEETLWLIGPAGAGIFDALPSASRSACSVAFEAAGIYTMASPQGSGAEAQLFIDAGEFGSLSAGHGHADALSLQLAAGGRLWLADPGTGAYMGEGSVRERFRGTAAHNTLVIDNRHQADPAGPFSWGPLPRIETRRWITAEGFDFWEGRHSGYERLVPPVTHRRSVLRWGSNFWLVRDVAEGSGTHRFDLYWHFDPEASVVAHGEEAVAHVGSACVLGLPSISLRGGWEPVIGTGEYSPAYGSVVPAPVAHWTVTSECPAEFATVLRLGADIAPASLRFTSLPGNGAAVYLYSSEGRRRWFFFALRDGESWTAGDWSSDAALVCFGEGALILADGSYVEYGRNRILSCRQKMAGVECRVRSGRWTVAGPAGGIEIDPTFLPGELP
jgi:hypothetical protein